MLDALKKELLTMALRRLAKGFPLSIAFELDGEDYLLEIDLGRAVAGDKGAVELSHLAPIPQYDPKDLN